MERWRDLCPLGAAAQYPLIPIKQVYFKCDIIFTLYRKTKH
ncbi:hypothetical protein BRO54_3402 [Geobacillus proteiniphilus]|uniref:Uncharacterized protein n=1 Tax=Geobacillus proteiniphilus TaxID=860353 RepID=A0A1Q5SM26_9BACL|nr:hypothetical protein BRO54_3402 [Geobacillus proteiniphilus]